MLCEYSVYFGRDICMLQMAVRYTVCVCVCVCVCACVRACMHACVQPALPSVCFFIS